MLGSCYCAGHNVKLNRSVKHKRVSNIENDGRFTWSTREVTTLTCPTVSLPVQKPGKISTVLSIQTEMGKTNEKKHNILKSVNNPPQPLGTVSDVKCDLPREAETRLIPMRSQPNYFEILLL